MTGWPEPPRTACVEAHELALLGRHPGEAGAGRRGLQRARRRGRRGPGTARVRRRRRALRIAGAQRPARRGGGRPSGRWRGGGGGLRLAAAAGARARWRPVARSAAVRPRPAAERRGRECKERRERAHGDQVAEPGAGLGARPGSRGPTRRRRPGQDESPCAVPNWTGVDRRVPPPGRSRFRSPTGRTG